jgi:molybdopterin-guanine dinucleotide biosynthesis protein B
MVGLTPVYRIVALETGIGKTSLGTELVSHLSRMGVKLAVIKQTHEKLLDELSDPGRYKIAGAETVFVSSPELSVIYREPFTGLREIISTMKYYPLIIAEGFLGTSIGKAIAIVRDSSEINALIKVDKGLWFIVSNDFDVVEKAKSIGFNALLMENTEQLAHEIYNDALQLIASKFSGEPEICGVGSWIELAEKILHGLIKPYECPFAYPLKIFIDDKPLELDPKTMRLVASLLEGFVSGVVETTEKPKKIRIEFSMIEEK